MFKIVAIGVLNKFSILIILFNQYLLKKKTQLRRGRLKTKLHGKIILNLFLQLVRIFSNTEYNHKS